MVAGVKRYTTLSWARIMRPPQTYCVVILLNISQRCVEDLSLFESEHVDRIACEAGCVLCKQFYPWQIGGTWSGESLMSRFARVWHTCGSSVSGVLAAPQVRGQAARQMSSAIELGSWAAGIRPLEPLEAHHQPNFGP